MANMKKTGMTSMKKEEAKRAVLSEYDRWAKKHPKDARMMGGFLYLPVLTERKVGPSRFPCGWRKVANRSRLASGSVGRLGSHIRARQKALCHPLKAEGEDRLFLGRARASPSGETGPRSQVHLAQARVLDGSAGEVD